MKRNNTIIKISHIATQASGEDKTKIIIKTSHIASKLQAKINNTSHVASRVSNRINKICHIATEALGDNKTR